MCALFLAAVAIHLASASVAGAQASRPSKDARAASVNSSNMEWAGVECGQAIASARRGHGAPEFGWALSRLQGCDTPGADAAVAALRSMRTLSDPVVLDSLTTSLLAWHDAPLLAAAIHLAKNEAATVESRVFAIRYLYSTVLAGAGRLSYADMVGGEQHCRAARGEDFAAGRPLATDYATTLRRVGTSLLNSDGVPTPVRAAALCLATMPRGE